MRLILLLLEVIIISNDKIMKLAFTAIISFFVSNTSYGVYAISNDILIHNGCTYILRNHDILENYFNVYPEKRPKSSVKFLQTNKQYDAKFEIIDNKLILIQIRVSRWDSINKQRYSFNAIKEVFNADSVLLDWFSGELVLSEDAGQYYEKCLVRADEFPFINISISKGIVLRELSIDNEGLDELTQKLFMQYKASPEFEMLQAHYTYMNSIDKNVEKWIFFLSAKCDLPKKTEVPNITF